MAGILLAAGDGSRIGRPKALVVIGGQSLARRGIGLLEAGGARPVVVVSGAASLDAELRGLVGPAADHGTGVSDRERPAVISVHNTAWQAGMGSSLAAGLAAVPAESTAAVLALADQPLVGPEAVRRLIAAHAAGASVAVACYDGKPRNPVLIGREHWAQVAGSPRATSARAPSCGHILSSSRTSSAPTPAGPDDIDTVEDLARVAALLATTTPFRS